MGMLRDPSAKGPCRSPAQPPPALCPLPGHTPAMAALAAPDQTLARQLLGLREHPGTRAPLLIYALRVSGVSAPPGPCFSWEDVCTGLGNGSSRGKGGDGARRLWQREVAPRDVSC